MFSHKLIAKTLACKCSVGFMLELGINVQTIELVGRVRKELEILGWIYLGLTVQISFVVGACWLSMERTSKGGDRLFIPGGRYVLINGAKYLL